MITLWRSSRAVFLAWEVARQNWSSSDMALPVSMAWEPPMKIVPISAMSAITSRISRRVNPARSPVADVVIRSVRLVRALGPHVVAALVVGARVAVLVGFIPGVEQRGLGTVDIGPAPAVGLVRRGREERLQALLRRRVVAYLKPVGRQGGLQALGHHELRDLDLGAAEEGPDVGKGEAGEEADDRDDHQYLDECEAAALGFRGEGHGAQRIKAGGWNCRDAPWGPK